MKTRVVKWFDRNIGTWMFCAQVLDYYDDPDLRKSQPDVVWWQVLKCTPDQAWAERIAAAVAENGNREGPFECVVAEFGESDLVESPPVYVHL